jgi:hypothetical protein
MCPSGGRAWLGLGFGNPTAFLPCVLLLTETNAAQKMSSSGAEKIGGMGVAVGAGRLV